MRDDSATSKDQTLNRSGLPLPLAKIWPKKPPLHIYISFFFNISLIFNFYYILIEYMIRGKGNDIFDTL
jgi:hypothetical protein